jgi:hypothetical protein
MGTTEGGAMTIRQRVAAIVAALALATAGLLVIAAPAQAYPVGCNVLSPWTAYKLTNAIQTTNRFYAQTTQCGNTNSTDIDIEHVHNQNGDPDCAYMRVELFHSDGTTAGAYTDLGPWTWKMMCDDDQPEVLMTGLSNEKYDVQVLTNGKWLWLGYMRD